MPRVIDSECSAKGLNMQVNVLGISLAQMGAAVESGRRFSARAQLSRAASAPNRFCSSNVAGRAVEFSYAQAGSRQSWSRSIAAGSNEGRWLGQATEGSCRSGIAVTVVTRTQRMEFLGGTASPGQGGLPEYDQSYTRFCDAARSGLLQEFDLLRQRRIQRHVYPSDGRQLGPFEQCFGLLLPSQSAKSCELLDPDAR